ncbi:hypothetical protein RB195_009702 [Necator americanus]
MLDTREGERAVYRLVRARHRSTLDMEHTKIVKGADGAVLRRSGEILERWREYYNHLCNEEFCHPPIPTVPSVEGPVLPITAVEVSAALAKMKSNKATGPDDIPADVWKLLGDRGSMWLSTLFNKIVAEGRTADVWQTSVTVPVWKGKGDIADCTSYRPIRLLCHTMKVFERVLEARLRKIVSVSLNQCGFVKDCSTIDAIYAVRILLEKHREKNRSVHLAFLDLEKAFDRVPHELLWMSMRSHSVPEEYVRWTKLLYAKPTSVVQCAAGTSRPFPVQVGVHQGSSLSPLLFILCMDTITKEIQKQHPWTLLFADDVMLAAESRDDLQKQCGPRIEDGSIRVDGTELNKVNCFKYLGFKVTSTGDIDQEGRARVNAAWMKWKMATGVLCEDLQEGWASCCSLRMRVLADNESLGKSAVRYGDADVKVDNRCNAKRESIQRHCALHFRRHPDNREDEGGPTEMVRSRLAARGRFCGQNRTEARRFRSEAAWEAKDSLVRPCEAGYDRCTFVYG